MIRLKDTSNTSRFVILGCGHTGTTLVSGILNINGYGSFSVSRLFENTELNDLNRRILNGSFEIAAVRDFIAKLERKTRGKWSLKDPRLSETIPIFYQLLHEPIKIIFNFRDPGSTVRSLIKEREMHETHLSPEEMRQSSEDEWRRRNRAVLEFLDRENRSPVLITRYDDLVERRLDESLSRFVGHELDLSFIEPGKRHSTPTPVSRELMEIYADLNRRFEANQNEIRHATVSVPVAHRGRGRSLRTRAHVIANRGVNEIRSIFKKLAAPRT